MHAATTVWIPGSPGGIQCGLGGKVEIYSNQEWELGSDLDTLLLLCGAAVFTLGCLRSAQWSVVPGAAALHACSEYIALSKRLIYLTSLFDLSGRVL